MKNFTLASGRKVSLELLHQRGTYAGVLAGKPGAQLNKMVLDDLVGEAQSYGLAESSPRLISPDPTALEGRLPGVACIAVLNSEALPHSREPYSTITIVWLQSELAPPIPPRIEAHIRNLDWETEAAEWCP